MLTKFFIVSAFVFEQFLHPMLYSYSLVFLIGVGAWYYLRREALAGRYTKNLFGHLKVFIPFSLYLYCLARVF